MQSLRNALIPFIVASAMRMTFASGAAGALSDSFTNWIDHPAIGYRTKATVDPVAALARRLDAGQTTLTDDGACGGLSGGAPRGTGKLGRGLERADSSPGGGE
jgi:hypothetical protein